MGSSNLAEIGFFKSKSGVLVIADTYIPEERWQRSSQCGSSWVVDFEPKNKTDKAKKDAEYLAHLEKSYDVIQLPDGAWRALVPDQVSASIVADQATRAITRDGREVDITCAPKRASKTVAKDATRESGVGMTGARGERMVALALRPGKMVEFFEKRDSQGDILEVIIKVVRPSR